MSIILGISYIHISNFANINNVFKVGVILSSQKSSYTNVISYSPILSSLILSLFINLCLFLLLQKFTHIVEHHLCMVCDLIITGTQYNFKSHLNSKKHLQNTYTQLRTMSDMFYQMKGPLHTFCVLASYSSISSS